MCTYMCIWCVLFCLIADSASISAPFLKFLCAEIRRRQNTMSLTNVCLMCLYKCMCMCMYVCVHTYVCIRVYAYDKQRMFIFICLSLHITHVYTTCLLIRYVLRYMHKRTCNFLQAWLCVIYVHCIWYIHKRTCNFICSRVYPLMYGHTHIYTYFSPADYLRLVKYILWKLPNDRIQ